MIRTNSLPMRGKNYTRYLAHYAKKNHVLLILSALFLAGVMLGAFLIRSAGEDTLTMLLRVVNGFIEKRREQTLLQNLFSTTSSSLIFVAAMFVCGFCAVSQPVIILAPLFRGLGFGFSAASLYASHGAHAAGFIVLFIFPDMLISSLAILLCCRESLRLSGNFWGMMWGSNSELYPLRIYFGRYVAASILCVISAFLEAVLYFAFANYFVLG